MATVVVNIDRLNSQSLSTSDWLFPLVTIDRMSLNSYIEFVAQIQATILNVLDRFSNLSLKVNNSDE
jgi:hypothetical protein